MTEEKVIIAGFGGQGVMLMGQLLAQAATHEGMHTTWFPSYGPETRGGTANCSVVFDNHPINSPVVSVPDSLLILNHPSLAKFQGKLKEGGVLVVNTSLVEEKDLRDDVRIIKVDANQKALEIGNLKVANMVMLGAYVKASGIFSRESLLKVFKERFTGEKQKLLEMNTRAFDAGMELAAD